MNMYRFVGADTLSSASQVCYSLAKVSKRLRELVESAMQGQRVCKDFLGRSVGVGDMAISKLLFQCEIQFLKY
jgi:hypothetical protein